MKQPTVEHLSVGFVGTYPPTKCGIATFTASLANAMASAGSGRHATVISCVGVPGVMFNQDPAEYRFTHYSISPEGRINGQRAKVEADLDTNHVLGGISFRFH